MITLPFSRIRRLRWNGFSVLLVLWSAIFVTAARATTLTPEELTVPFAIGPVKPDPSRNLVYIVDRTYNRLLALDTAAGQQAYAANIEDGATSGEMTVSIDGSKLYLAETSEDKILVFSLPTLTPLTSIPLAFPPVSIAAAENGRLFATVANGTDNSIVEINPANGSILHTFGTSEGYYYQPLLRTNAAGTNLYAGTTSLSGFLDIYEYSLASNPISAAVGYEYESENMIDFAADETNSRIYVMNGGIYGINVINTTNDNFATDWSLTGAYGVGISYNSAATVVFGASGDPYEGDVREYSRTDGAPIADWVVATDAKPIQHQGIAATANGNVIYVRSTDGETSPAFLGFISATGSAMELFPTIDQTVTFTTISSGSVGGQSVLQASSDTGLAITYAVVSGPATISGNVLTYTGTGTVIVSASQAGNLVFKPKSVTQNISVTLATQTIHAFNVISDKNYGTAPFSIAPPTATSGLPVTVTIKSGPATLSGNLITITGAGAVTLAADQAGNVTYLAAPEVTTSFVVLKAPQTISAFGTIVAQTVGEAPFTITLPTSNVGLPVTVIVQSGPATISGNKVTPTGIGTVVLSASQAGNTNYAAATTVTTQFIVNPGKQSITAFKAIAAKSFTAVPFAITLPTATSGLPVAVTVLSGPATLSGANVTLTGIGTVILAANQPGNASFAAAVQVTTSFVVKQAVQTITPFSVIPAQSFGEAPFAITLPTSSSGLAVNVFVKSGPATLAGNTVTVTAMGTVVLAATQTGNADFTAAKEVTASFIVGKEAQTITAFSTIAEKAFGAAPFSITLPTASSSLPVTVKVKSGPAKISGLTVTMTGAGTVVLAADQIGNTTFAAAPEVTTSFIVDKIPQTIAAFTAISSKVFGSAAFAVPAPVASSGLAVTLTVQSGPAKIALGKVTLTGAGTVVLAANQAGNTTIAAAPTVTTSFTVTQEAQTLAAFKTIAARTFSVTPFAVIAPAATSKLPTVLTVLSGPATIAAGKVTLTGVGTVTLAANQPGNANFQAAPEVTTSFVVSKASQTISKFSLIAAKTTASVPFAIKLPTATSGLAVTVIVKSGPATLAGNIVTVTGSGTVVLAADQAGNADFNAATEVTVTFTVK